MEASAEPLERQTHTVRVYQNTEDGTNWWAEDDLGFAGGADQLPDLMDAIREWAEAEGVLDDLSVNFVESTTGVAP